jgi:hypothetical protein
MLYGFNTGSLKLYGFATASITYIYGFTTGQPYLYGFNIENQYNIYGFDTSPFTLYSFDTSTTGEVPTKTEFLTPDELLLNLIQSQFDYAPLINKFTGKLSGGISVTCDIDTLNNYWAVRTLLLMRRENMLEYSLNGVNQTVEYFDNVYNRPCLYNYFYCIQKNYETIENLLGFKNYSVINTPYFIIDPIIQHPPVITPGTPVSAPTYMFTEVWSNDSALIGTGMFLHIFVGPLTVFSVQRPIRALREVTVNGVSIIPFVAWSGTVVTLPSDYAVATTDTLRIVYEG